MASRQFMSSILKSPNVRATLKKIESVEQDADKNTATSTKRKVSFSRMKKIKMYDVDSICLTLDQAPIFDEQIPMLSDSPNAENTPSSGKFENSDAQISIESANCTNLEDNGPIIIDYESPDDDMEVTETLQGDLIHHSHSYSKDETTKLICVKDRSNVSTVETFQNNELSRLENRRSSYNNRVWAPLFHSSLGHKRMKEDLKSDDVIQLNPIKNDIINKSLTSEQLKISNELQVDFIEKESIKESLCKEGLEFLTRWNEQFIEKKLVLVKCTNREWIFNLLDNNILLTVTYAYTSNDCTFLKVEDISFTAKTITNNEIIKFGINWILSKYDPAVYKPVCFSSKDIELLLKSLLEDVHFISKLMNNMAYVRDIYCVTFKDNKAELVLGSMPSLMMVRIEIALSNIHKPSVRDLYVDCLFGSFDTKSLEKVIEDIPKDSNVLQSLVEKLLKLYTYRKK